MMGPQDRGRLGRRGEEGGRVRSEFTQKKKGLKIAKKGRGGGPSVG